MKSSGERELPGAAEDGRGRAQGGTGRIGEPGPAVGADPDHGDGFHDRAP
jgi:hypothetical protein